MTPRSLAKASERGCGCHWTTWLAGSVCEWKIVKVMGGASFRGQRAYCALLMVALAGCADAANPMSELGAGGAGGAASVGGSSGFGGNSGGTGGQPAGPQAERIPMFVAQGHAGRTIVSCDDGRTWLADQSDEAWGHCNDHDCDHAPGSARGITWGEGWFFATFGWGSPGSLRRSRDGMSWEPLLQGKHGGVAYGNGRLVAASRDGQYSDDEGESWHDFSEVELTTWSVRDAAFVPYDGGRFIMAARDDVSEIVISRDGESWKLPEQVPPECGAGAYQGGIVYGNGTLVTTSPQGVACYSRDGGRTWSSQSVAPSFRTNIIWSGSEFMTWTRGTLYRSTDGEAWATVETQPTNVDIGVAAMSDEGTIVGISNGWQQHYDSQAFYRSEDGVQWEVLPPDAYTGGHPIKAIAFGYGDPSPSCFP